MTQPIVFISSSLADIEWKKRVVRHIQVLEAQGLLKIWDSYALEPGVDLDVALESAIKRAHLAVLLVSADYLADDNVLLKEVTPLLARRQTQSLHVIPVLLKHCTWQVAPWLSSLQLFPPDQRPLSEAQDASVDAFLADLSTLIHRSITAQTITHNHKDGPPPVHSPKPHVLGIPVVKGLLKPIVLAALIISIAAALRLVLLLRVSPVSAHSPTAPDLEARAEEDRGPYRGVVTDKDALPLGGLRVLLFGTTCETTTGKNNGVFDFSDCDPSQVRRLKAPRIYVFFQDRVCRDIHLEPPPVVVNIKLDLSTCDWDYAGYPLVIPSTDLAPTTGPPKLSQGEIQGVVAAHAGRIRKRCWHPAIDRAKAGMKLNARISGKIVIAQNGTVSMSVATGAEREFPGLSNCISEQMKDWRFSPSSESTAVDVPFAFAGR